MGNNSSHNVTSYPTHASQNTVAAKQKFNSIDVGLDDNQFSKLAHKNAMTNVNLNSHHRIAIKNPDNRISLMTQSTMQNQRMATEQSSLNVYHAQGRGTGTQTKTKHSSTSSQYFS